ncbi:MAG: hypothetical protein ACYC42_11505 [Lysobacter sp.]
MAKSPDNESNESTAPTTPPTADPKPGRRNPGYAEPQPRDGNDVRQPGPRKSPDPDAGGLDRKPVETPDAADHD